MIKHYQIGTVLFSLICPKEMHLEEEELFTSFEVDKPGEVTFVCHKGMPVLPADVSLHYSDRRNLIYKNAAYVYRYIGNFMQKDRSVESQSCIVYEGENPSLISLYLPEANSTYSVKRLFSRMGLEQILAWSHHVILHSSFIMYQGKGILFSAPSGTGKSTQADLWEKYVPGTEIINGDRSVLSIRDKKPVASGIPFCGSSQIAKNKEAPLSAVVILRQGRENQIRRLSQAEAVKFLYGECSVNTWDQRAVENILQVLEQIAAAVPVYYYVCRKDATAVETLYRTIYRRKNYEPNTDGT